MQGVARLVQNAADAEDDDDEEEEDVPVKPSLSRPGKRGMRSAGAVGLPSPKPTLYIFAVLLRKLGTRCVLVKQKMMCVCVCVCVCVC